jgi:ammonia channel protein AmtB
MVFTPGFGVQYLAWLVPWAVAAGFVPALLWYSTSGVFLFAVYTYWSQQLPWYYANSLKMRDWGGSIVVAEIGAWLATAAVLVVLLRRAGAGVRAAHDGRIREEGQAQIREGRAARSQPSA